MGRIGIDARLFNQTGVGTYVRNLLYYLPRSFTELHHVTAYVLPSDVDDVKRKCPRLNTKVVPYQWHTLSEQTGFFETLMNEDNDLMHFTYFSYPVRYSKPFIATIHDLTPILYKTGKASTRNALVYSFKHAVFRYVLWSQFTRAVRVITPTKTVKDELLEYYGDKYGDKIFPIYEGVDNSLYSTEPSDLSSDCRKPYLLYVGNFYPHKNIKTLIQAMQGLKKTLILAGPGDYFSSYIKQMVKQMNLDDRVIFRLNPTRSDLVYLYSNAEALIHPSLSEGFGLPIVEAMNFNTPIIASDIPVFKELLEDKYTSFDPTDAQSIVRAVKQNLSSKNKVTYSGLVERYSFQQMAIETMQCYNRALQQQ